MVLLRLGTSMGVTMNVFLLSLRICDNFILEYFRILRLFGVMDRHTVSRQISMSMVGNSKFGEKVVKGPLIFADCQKILLKLLQPELLFRGWLSHERALHTRSINGMSHRSSGKKAILCGLQQSVLCFNVLHLSILLHVMEPKVCTQTSQGR